MAADTYDATTGTLTIPLVKVGNTLYKNARVTVASVVSVGSLVTTDSRHLRHCDQSALDSCGQCRIKHVLQRRCQNWQSTQ